MEKKVPPPLPTTSAAPRRALPPLPARPLPRRRLPPPIPSAARVERLTEAELAPEEPNETRAREADELVEQARRGDPRAFEGLVKKYRHRIFALALHMTGSPSDADDITQDAFVRAFRSMDRFEGRSEFFTWLYRIALNRALNVRRDQKRRRTTDLEDPRVVVAIAVDSGGDPARALELRETYVCLVRAFDRLSPLLRTTVALTMMQGLSYPEAAVVLETTEGTIAWRIHEARKQMREAIASHFDAARPEAARAARKDPTPLPARRRAPVEPEPVGPPSLEMALALLAPTV
jgi:RNA polymerase sigma-70 factor (ECF subfamily)